MMNIYEINKIEDLLKNNSYAGRGIICGKSKDGLPFGVQFMGKTFNENDLFNIAYFFEQNVGKDFITRI